ncbi:metallophosphoesterase [Brachyspira murdochii]|uniref:Phosphoesterase n=1 Tax=Brachyspira murdochii TaxID=84378 RepID=A0ABX5B472_9SPIR|nr:metallophosphoesterase [Brachyspira murdochii]PPS21983.1 phosphoesterase [Brachyspira murdochii]
MKISVIGDLHGKDCWKKLLEGRFSEFDKIIFMGDYSDDSWVRFDDEEIINNLKDVIEFKKNHNDNVELLIGNHDFQYIVGYPTASRYRESYAKEMNKIFNDNANIFKPIHIENNYIFTHAGITNGWIDYIKNKYNIDNINIDNIESIVNIVYKNDKDDCNIASFRRGGLSRFAGILWADTEDLTADSWVGYNQVVGHNRVKPYSIIKKDDSIIYMSDHFDSEQDKLLVLDI